MDGAEAERLLLGLELFGMRFGLERMHALLARLGDPQRTFRSVHVVGSNGKSSTTRFAAALLQAEGLRTGAYLSPHLISFAERVRVDGRDLGEDAFGAAVGRAAEAVARVDAERSDDDHVTQFELLTAAALCALAQAGVEVAVLEAGLGGRFDATNVLPSAVQVLTPVTLEHTRWLGSTVTAITGEKADVVRPGGTLVLHAGVDAEATAVAERVAAERGARVVRAPADLGLELAAHGTFQPANFAAAHAAATALLGREPARDLVARVAATTAVPGRFEVLETAPEGGVTIRDGAHNPAGCEALAATLAVERHGRRVACVLSVLDDKDAEAMVRTLAPAVDVLVCTRSHNPRALAADALAAAALRAGVEPAHVVVAEEPRAAVEEARALAGPGQLTLVTGSLHLLADLARAGTGHAASAF